MNKILIIIIISIISQTCAADNAYFIGLQKISDESKIQIQEIISKENPDIKIIYSSSNNETEKQTRKCTDGPHDTIKSCKIDNPRDCIVIFESSLE